MLDASVAEGHEIPAREFGPLDRLNLVRMALFLHDPNPVHLDRVYATERGLKDVVQQGPLNVAYLMRMVTDWMGEAGEVRHTSIRFRANAHPGEILHNTGRVVRRYQENGEALLECEINQTSSSGATILSGRVLIRLR